MDCIVQDKYKKKKIKREVVWNAEGEGRRFPSSDLQKGGSMQGPMCP